jgi:predicted ATPase
LLLILDDVQWADVPSLILLDHIADQLRGTRILIMATCRPPQSVDELVTTAGLSASAALVASIHADTAGNPFLVREVVQTMAERADGASRWSVPAAVVNVTAHWVNQLADDSSSVLAVAGVAGGRFSIGVVAQLLDPAGALVARSDRRLRTRRLHCARGTLWK